MIQHALALRDSQPSLFRLLAKSRSRLAAARQSLEETGPTGRHRPDLHQARLRTFGTLQALSVEFSQRNALPQLR